MNKKDALKRIDSIEVELKELKVIVAKEDDKIESYTDVLTFEDACLVLDRKPAYLRKFWANTCGKTEAEILVEELKIVIEAVNKLIKTPAKFPDWENTNQQKHYPYFSRTNAGWVLYYVLYDYYSAGVGSGFYYKSEAGVKHVVNHFMPNYNAYLR